MSIDRTLEDRQNLYIPPASQSSNHIILWLLLGGIFLLLVQGGANRLKESLYPYCPPYGLAEFEFKPDVSPSEAQEVAMPNEPLLSAARYNLGGSSRAYAAVEPMPPTTREEFRMYLSTRREHPSVAKIKETCPPQFAEGGVAIERRIPVMKRMLEKAWLIVSVLTAVASLAWGLRKDIRRWRSQTTDSLA